MWDLNLKSFLDGVKDLSSGNMPVVQKGCDYIGCPEKGDYKAPKSRYDLKDYYWFCLEHVEEYNKQWDYFKGMSASEIQHHMQQSALGDRPTWKSTKAGLHDDKLKQKIYEHFSKGESVFGQFDAEEDAKAEKPKMDFHVPEHPSVEAMAILEIAPPITWDEIKSQYKKMAKQYHPDTNKEKDAEEKFKKISMAYSILKMSYENYSQLEER